MLGVAALGGALVGALLVPRAQSAGGDAPLPEVRLLGQALTLGDDAQETALGRVRRYAAGKIALELPDGKREDVALARLGAEIDRARLTALVRDARDPTSPLRRAWLSSGRSGPIELPVPIDLAPERALLELQLFKDKIDRLPSDARLDLEAKRLVPEVTGRLLDVDATLAALRVAIAQGERSAKVGVEEVAPRRRASELGGVEFGEVLGSFETVYNRAERWAARTFNLRLAASRLDGTVLLPGEVFDFNQVVGARDEANGYKVAPVIAEGELVDGIGGGTCQISGTLHGAAFFAGLSIVERYPHTRPSSYIKMGLDATVVYPTITFRIRNDLGEPVVLHEVVKNGVVRAEILGRKRTRTVTLIRKVDGFLPFEQVERPDPTLPEGTRVLGQRGVPGFKLHRYRIVRQGAHAVRERWNDTYPPTTQIVRVGTGASGDRPKHATDDAHPEYVADELLVATQGIDAEGDAKGGLVETREPGKTGKAGWTEEAGMPVWHAEGVAAEEKR